jgi:CRISPR-associated exonuclease Cas4
MEREIPISYLNDFIFCPRSIYYHQLYEQLSTRLYQRTPQIAGTFAHKAIDEKKYSTSKMVLQGIDVYSSVYGIYGKIDTFNEETGVLTERKKKIKVIYDGYVFQIYAQYFALKEMGYLIKKIKLYSMDDNKNYPIPLPEEDLYMKNKFDHLIHSIKTYEMEDQTFVANPNKCRNCIYSNLCDYSLC